MKRRGFTLIELMVAGMMATIVLGGVTTALSQLGSSKSISRQRLEAFARCDTALRTIRRDVITLLRTQFNDIRTREFKEKDWHFWKDNMFEHLNPGGQLFLKTNLKFQKKVIGGMQTEIMKAFGPPIKGFNSYTYHFTKP